MTEKKRFLPAVEMTDVGRNDNGGKKISPYGRNDREEKISPYGRNDRWEVENDRDVVFVVYYACESCMRRSYTVVTRPMRCRMPRPCSVNSRPTNWNPNKAYPSWLVSVM